MTEEITPALTPEAWEGLCVEGECRADEVWGLAREWHFDPEQRANEFDTPEPNYHAIAAICLKDQPFGFTQEDVELLRFLADEAARYRNDDEGDEGHDLADKIAALLPPPTP